MNGIVIVDKPQGWTSQDVTARLRRVFNTRRIGHGGTLDPMATGVLPVFVGRATRAVEFFEHAEKAYETVLRLGIGKAGKQTDHGCRQSAAQSFYVEHNFKFIAIFE